MAIQGMNMPSIAGVLGFKDFTQQLNNSNAGMRNLVGIANDWAKMASQQSNAEKQAQAQRDFQAEQNQLNRDFQDAQQQERFEHELGMFDKQQEKQLKNDAAKFKFGLNEAMNVGLSDKADTNDMNELKLRNKVNEIKEHRDYFNSDEDWMNAIANATQKANEIMIHNKGVKVGNTLDKEFKEFRDGDFRNAQAMGDWLADNIDYIQTYRPDMEQKVYATLERKQREQDEDNLKWAMLQNQMRNSNIGVRSNIRKEKKELNELTQEEKEDALMKALQQ
jgi:hypothetical protein